MKNYENMGIEELWLANSKSCSADRGPLLEALAEKLWIANRRDESIQVWFATVSAYAESADSHGQLDALLRLSYRLSLLELHLESLISSMEGLELARQNLNGFFETWFAIYSARATESLYRSEEQLEFAEIAVSAAREQGEDKLLGHALREYADALDANGLGTPDISTWIEMEQLAQRGGDLEHLCIQKIALGKKLLQIGETSKCLEKLTDALSLARFTANQDQISQALLELGKYESLRGNHKAAFELFQPVLDSKDSEVQRKCAAEAMFVVGRVQTKSGNRDLGYKQIKQILPVLEALNLRSLAREARDLLG